MARVSNIPPFDSFNRTQGFKTSHLVTVSTCPVKTIPIPKKGQACYRCHENVFQASRGGGDFALCILCGKICICCAAPNDLFTDFEAAPAILDESHYSGSCNILFGFGCTHAENGCTDGTQFGTLISSFEWEKVRQVGMPRFVDAKRGTRMGTQDPESNVAVFV